MFQTTLPSRNIADILSVAPGLIPEPVGQTSSDKQVDKLRTRHNLYREYQPNWDLYLSAYEGGPDFANQHNLHKHSRENDIDYENRVHRLHYLNYCDQLVDFFTNFIFSETIHRDGGSEDSWYRDFIGNVNRKGDDITYVMRQISDETKIFGHLWILVDLPKLNIENADFLSRQDEEDMNVKPYWVVMKPDEILDWTTDDFDNLQYVKRGQVTNVMYQGVNTLIEKYTEWAPEVTTITWVDITESESPKVIHKENIPNTLGFIPIIVARYKRSKRHPFMGNSFLRDFAPNNREIMNYTSLIQEFLYKQCFNLLAKESDANGLPLNTANDMILGVSNIIEYPHGAKAPSYITPPVDPAEFLQSERASIVREMFKRAAQETMNELMNGEKSSGFSQSQSFSKTVPFIANQADTLESLENQLMQLSCKLAGKTWKGSIKYKDRYELTNVTDAITQLTSVFRDLLFPSETFVKEELKRLVDELDGKLQPDKRAQILKEIDDMDFSQWQTVQEEALVGGGAGGGNSPATQQKPKQTNTTAEVAAEAKVATGTTKKLKK